MPIVVQVCECLKQKAAEALNSKTKRKQDVVKAELDELHKPHKSITSENKDMLAEIVGSCSLPFRS